MRESTEDLIKGMRSLAPYAKESDIQTCATISEKVLDAVDAGECTDEAVTELGYIFAVRATTEIPLRNALLMLVADMIHNSEDRFAVRKIICDMIPD